MAQHTPGPWRTDAEVGHEAVLGPRGFMVADCAIFGRNATSRDTLRANARLIAAAPDLLAALEAMVDRWEPDSEGSDRRMWETACAAIAKARGS